MSALLVFVILWFYFIPSLVAGYRNHHQGLAIFMLNLFLGWTFLGWVVALVWACTVTHPSPSDGSRTAEPTSSGRSLTDERVLTADSLNVSSMAAPSRLSPWQWWFSLIAVLILISLSISSLMQRPRSGPLTPTTTTLPQATSLATPTSDTVSSPKRTLLRSVPAGHIYSYENAAGETVEEMENRQGQLLSRRFYRPAPLACAYLQSLDLRTDRYWRDSDEPLFHCLSPMTPLGTAAEPYGLGLQNNLAYYVDGDATRPHQMLLKLNVNQRQEAKQAHQALLRAARVLTQQALNTPLPMAGERAITAGKPWRGTLKTAMLELAREDWPTSKGYDLKFLIRPNQ